MKIVLVLFAFCWLVSCLWELPTPEEATASAFASSRPLTPGDTLFTGRVSGDNELVAIDAKLWSPTRQEWVWVRKK